MDKLDQLLESLNPAQREAVVYQEGPTLVNAGAGSGKTRVLVHKIAYLLAQGIPGSRIMALTFTNKAAREMKERIHQLVGREASHLRIGTFHSVFMNILKTYADRLGFSSSFSIYDTQNSISKLKNIIKLMALDEKVYKPKDILSRISNAKNRLLLPEAYRASTELIKEDIRAGMPRFAEIYARYSFELKQSNAMDFDDLLLWTNILFRDHPDVLRTEQERLDYLLIDEYQDTNFAQFNIARLLMQERGDIFVVGDDAQSIYAFRGANIRNMLDFATHFPRVKTFALEQNYRSTQAIVKTAARLIRHNREQLPKEVFSRGALGEPLTLHEAYSSELEAQWVVQSVQDIRRTQGASYDDFAILYRTNAQSRILEQTFRLAGVPFRIWGGFSFFKHKEVMDAIAYFRLMINPQDEEALLRIINYPKRGIGQTTIDKLRTTSLQRGRAFADLLNDPQTLEEVLSRGTASKIRAFVALIEQMRLLVAEQKDLYSLSRELLLISGVLADLESDKSPEGKVRLQNIEELLSSIGTYAEDQLAEGGEPSLASYISEAALMTDQDTQGEDEATPRVTLMTIHASKGLEYPHVFIVGLEEGLLPSTMSLGSTKGVEEERRLLYVALTRAEQTCHLSYAQERFRHGRTETSPPSRFISELPQELLRRNNAPPVLRQNFRPRAESKLPESFPQTDFLSTSPQTPRYPSQSRRIHIGRRLEDDAPEEQHERIGNLSRGMRVRHNRFGLGEIQTLEGKGDNAKARVRFDSGEEKTLLLRFAKLEPLQ